MRGKIPYLFLLSLVSVAGTLGLGSSARSQPGSATLEEVNRTFQEADELEAGLLSPQHYSSARKHLANARNKLDKGQAPARARKDLAQALEELKLAIQAAELARVALKDLIAARSETVDSGLALDRSKNFKQAEKKFQEAVRKVEKRDTKGARKPSRAAARSYRKAVLQSLEKDVVAEAEKQLRSSRKMVPNQARQKASDSLQRIRRDLKAKAKADFPVGATVSQVRDGVTRALEEAGVRIG